jgi:hypothetical protein
MDRLARSLRQLIETVEDLEKRDGLAGAFRQKVTVSTGRYANQDDDNALFTST